MIKLKVRLKREINFPPHTDSKILRYEPLCCDGREFLVLKCCIDDNYYASIAIELVREEGDWYLAVPTKILSDDNGKICDIKNIDCYTRDMHYLDYTHIFVSFLEYYGCVVEIEQESIISLMCEMVNKNKELILSL